MSLKWDEENQELSGWSVVNGQRTFVRIPRETIHSELSIYNDAVGWEIERFKEDIAQRLCTLVASRKESLG